MPIPSPNGKQDRGGFVSNCMSDEVMKKEYPDPKQRTAVCHSKWKKAKGEIVVDFTEQIKALEGTCGEVHLDDNGDMKLSCPHCGEAVGKLHMFHRPDKIKDAQK